MKLMKTKTFKTASFILILFLVELTYLVDYYCELRFDILNTASSKSLNTDQNPERTKS